MSLAAVKRTLKAKGWSYRSAVKRTLKAKGWSYRSAAPELGVCYQHLAFVLTGRRESRRLLTRIAALPPRGKETAR